MLLVNRKPKFRFHVKVMANKKKQKKKESRKKKKKEKKVRQVNRHIINKKSYICICVNKKPSIKTHNLFLYFFVFIAFITLKPGG